VARARRTDADAPRPQREQLGELARHRDRAIALGARIVLDRTGDEDEPLYVLADPSGHPFCLLVR
jgi:hypothetical protein